MEVGLLTYLLLFLFSHIAPRKAIGCLPYHQFSLGAQVFPRIFIFFSSVSSSLPLTLPNKAKRSSTMRDTSTSGRQIYPAENSRPILRGSDSFPATPPRAITPHDFEQCKYGNFFLMGRRRCPSATSQSQVKQPA